MTDLIHINSDGTIDQLDCALCGGDHAVDDCPDPFGIGGR